MVQHVSPPASGYRALVIDDDKEMRASLGVLLERSGWTVSVAASAQAALDRMEAFDPDVVLSDVRMPGMTGLDLLTALKGHDVAPPLVLISAHGDIPTAVKAMQDGAYSFLEKPFDPRRLLAAVLHAAENHRLLSATRALRDQLSSLSGLDRVMLGQSSGIAALREDVIDIAAQSGSVLVQGATGTGKELVARALHTLSPRREGPFVAVNCATIAPDRFDEQMFGVLDGVTGWVRRADGGTLFLDEISACPPSVQAKLLRVLETGEVTPLGSDTMIQTDVRIVAAANEGLAERVTAGTFREDLLYRLNTFEVHLPSLRDRGEDVILLFGHFVEQLSETYEITPPPLTAEDAAALLAHDWPGNVRELRHVAERRVLSARRGGGSVAAALRMTDTADDVPDNLRAAVAAFERTLIANAIKTHGGRMDAVAEALGIGRRTLNEKIVKLGLKKADLLE
ncbi:DNA-binding NtrC family response regulator [Rubricella aquisinus]|uniref:Nif-specific regulatory protein n=1 Tax=Rubricella aquisinus TaxID=2028108 RepID=A0A840WYJ1_9RHOB|nr:sigma-54 dependent transcriptional regulator [Rubricella aquisinus]MBB5516220.1 DNA-binding NtrC family response regulator [Rubricella aquisinus]